MVRRRQSDPYIDDPSSPFYNPWGDDMWGIKEARARAATDIPFSTEAGLDDPPPNKKRLLDDEDVGALLMRLARTHPRRLKKALRAIEWLDEEGRKAGIW